MNISWYFGFGYKPVLLSLGACFAIYYYFEGWIYWVLYAVLVVTLAYMIIRLRLYWREPWHRMHDRSVLIVKELIKGEHVAETAAERNMRVCRELAGRLMKSSAAVEFLKSGLLTDNERKKYYRQLVECYPAMFTKNINPEKREEALKNLLKDIEASNLDPKIVITFAIEKKYGGQEAARYLFAIASGYVA